MASLTLTLRDLEPFVVIGDPDELDAEYDRLTDELADPDIATIEVARRGRSGGATWTTFPKGNVLSVALHLRGEEGFGRVVDD